MDRDTKAHPVEKLVQKIALPVIAAAAILLIFGMVVSSQNTANENNAYIRVINCIVSQNISTRTQDQIEQCYVTVERDLDIRLQRYDSSNSR